MIPPEQDLPVRIAHLPDLPLDANAREAAATALLEGPGAPAWRLALDRFALYAGSALLLAGIICFFAFNWDHLHRLAKLGLAAGALATAAGAAWFLGLERTAGRAALGCACVLTGVLMAVHGQVYQTGADPYELFRLWALVILPWLFLARSQPLWAFWVLLLDLWAGLWWEQTGQRGWQGAFLLLAAVTLGAWLLREGLQERRPWLRGRWMPRLLLAPGLACLLPPAMDALLDKHAGTISLVALLLTVSLCGGLFLFFRRQRRDLFMVTAALAALIVLITSLLIRLLILDSQNGCGAFMLTGLLLAAQMAFAAWWLRQLHREDA